MKKLITAKEVNRMDVEARIGSRTEVWFLGSIFEGDMKLSLYESLCGAEFITCRGKTLWCHEKGFDAVKRTILHYVNELEVA